MAIRRWNMDSEISRAIDLRRFDAHVQFEVANLLNAMLADLASIVHSAETPFTKGRMRAVYAQARPVIRNTFAKLAEKYDQQVTGLFATEMDFAHKVLTGFYGTQVITSPVITKETVDVIVRNLLIRGTPAAEWWRKQSAATVSQFRTQVGVGFLEGETLPQIVRRVIGGKRHGRYIGGIMDIQRRNANALVRTAVNAISARAKDRVYRANADVIAYIEQISTLDNRTTLVCRAYDGKRWDVVTKKPVPPTTLPYRGGVPRHFSCRSVEAPGTKSWEELGIEGPKEWNAGQRASMSGPVPATWSMDDWLNQYNDTTQNKILGKARASLWRRNEISLAGMLDQTGRPLTLAQIATDPTTRLVMESEGLSWPGSRAGAA